MCILNISIFAFNRWFHGATTEKFTAGLICELMSAKPKPEASWGNQAT